MPGSAQSPSTMPASGSRKRTDALLAGLREGGWRPAAWGRFLGRATIWSAHAVLAKPHAAVQVTALHAALAAVAPGRRQGWIATSWGLSITHLGLLGPQRHLGWPNALTLVRANLAALGDSAPGPERPHMKRGAMGKSQVNGAGRRRPHDRRVRRERDPSRPGRPGRNVRRAHRFRRRPPGMVRSSDPY